MLKDKINNKEKLIGMHINLCDITVSKIAGVAGYDFVWIDMEHSYMPYDVLLGHIIALQGTDTAVIVRAPQNDLTATKKIIEMGPDGIIFPMVKTAEEANTLIGYTLYPPYGNRGFGPMNAIDYGNKDVLDYIHNNHRRMCRFIQIEHKETIENLDDIMKNEYIDGYIFGPNDLSGSINELCDVFGERTTALIRGAIKRLKSKNKYIGVSTGDTDETVFKHWHDMGIDMISAGADFGFLLNAATENRNMLLKAHKGA